MTSMKNYCHCNLSSHCFGFSIINLSYYPISRNSPTFPKKTLTNSHKCIFLAALAYKLHSWADLSPNHIAHDTPPLFPWQCHCPTSYGPNFWWLSWRDVVRQPTSVISTFSLFSAFCQRRQFFFFCLGFSLFRWFFVMIWRGSSTSHRINNVDRNMAWHLCPSLNNLAKVQKSLDSLGSLYSYD